jgi:TRAP-type mannitol/chloroaromatic compound transport system permease small subunit
MDNRTTLDRITDTVDAISIWAGKIVAWLIVPMFAVLVYEVIVRKFFRPTIWANDIATMCYGAHFFLAAAYTLHLQKHIRTDFFSKDWPLHVQVKFDIAQYLLFFLPGMVMFTYMSWQFAAESWDLKEAPHDHVAAARVLVQDDHPGELGAPPPAGARGSAQVLQDPAHRDRLPAPRAPERARLMSPEILGLVLLASSSSSSSSASRSRSR